MQPIVILSHWHTASSIISKTLKECGMFVGNKNTFWDETCEVNCEHSLMNNTMADIFYHGVTKERLDIIEKILISYNQEKHPFYGIKVTHGLQVWDKVRNIFKNQWPTAKYIVGIQHPIGIIKTLRTRPHSNEWPDKRILESWMSIENSAMELIASGAYIMDCQLSWPKGFNKILKGLKIKPVKSTIYDGAKIHKINMKEKNDFKIKHPEAIRLYEKLLKSVTK